jgi:hypothetical protein
MRVSRHRDQQLSKRAPKPRSSDTVVAQAWVQDVVGQRVYEIKVQEGVRQRRYEFQVQNGVI